MPVIYECDGEGCDVKDHALCVRSDQGHRLLLPPYRWRMLDIPTRAEPAVLCPGCGEKVDDAQHAANDPAPARPRFGVIDGGKDKP